MIFPVCSLCSLASIFPYVVANLFPCVRRPHTASFAAVHSHSLDILPLLWTASIADEESIWKLAIATAGSSLRLNKNKFVTKNKLFFSPQTIHYYIFSMNCTPSWFAHRLTVCNFIHLTPHKILNIFFLRHGLNVFDIFQLIIEINNNYFA